jgi:hypothetical protein
MGVVKPRKMAREDFECHLYTGRAAGLLEQNTPEVFTATLGKIPADTKVTVEVSFITLLKNHFGDSKGITTLNIPTCIVSRYGSPEGFDVASSTDVPEGLSLNTQILQSENIRSITSTTHQVKVHGMTYMRTAGSWADFADEEGDAAHTSMMK